MSELGQKLIPFKCIQDRIVELAKEQPWRKSIGAYFISGQPECIIGHVLADIGVGADGTRLVNKNGVPTSSVSHLADTFDWNEFGVQTPTRRQIGWVQVVQSRQDYGDTWGEAVKRAGRQ
ncbi:hypothetical protein SEA_THREERNGTARJAY_130 [Mycobacterium phage ThreeRngTarjay]|uniref:Uncharacterized protein n=1 Tax=Mycobacterium phage Duke13 TaxID=2499038 RepID=A0A3S9UAY1_9CAUD|nr:hypothetical protein N857_gp133 [Mycobacterium phage Wanda]AXQ62536.1 hypothetical protein SEA_ZELINK_129 [Mycobacterium phage Zelink]AZS07467.1 hypothetical protein PBI_DUKE13_129 [Mycobacterium phage Duke13]QBI97578.1 hypothetical protein SEA_HUGHESYANG_134 [Mycobacterium phage Hughesyang]QBI99760.1 hypothetical protein SEA_THREERNGTARJAY_130 [Mycobacterium phage ThreeRngTarjay]QBJ00082.1 hypothetical protein SEA_PHOEBUS_135 [Mycobacterium phage Phoebus]